MRLCFRFVNETGKRRHIRVRTLPATWVQEQAPQRAASPLPSQLPAKVLWGAPLVFWTGFRIAVAPPPFAALDECVRSFKRLILALVSAASPFLCGLPGALKSQRASDTPQPGLNF